MMISNVDITIAENNIWYFSGPLFVVVEFAANGNLRQFLRERRPSFYQDANAVAPKEHLTIKDFISYAYQVSRGMSYLSSKKVQYCLQHNTHKYIHTHSLTHLQECHDLSIHVI